MRGRLPINGAAQPFIGLSSQVSGGNQARRAPGGGGLRDGRLAGPARQRV